MTFHHQQLNIEIESWIGARAVGACNDRQSLYRRRKARWRQSGSRSFAVAGGNIVSDDIRREGRFPDVGSPENPFKRSKWENVDVDASGEMSQGSDRGASKLIGQWMKSNSRQLWRMTAIWTGR
jgi:hypothetical protein